MSTAISDRVYRELTTTDGALVIVRQAVPDDAEGLMAAMRATLDERLDALVTQPEEFTLTLDQERAWIQGYLDSDTSLLLVAEHAGEIVASADLRGATRQRARHTANLGIAVARAWRGRGVGRAVMEALLDWATANPVLEKINLTVTAANEPAHRLYRHLGFVEEGHQVGQLKKADGTYLDTILMSRFLP